MAELFRSIHLKETLVISATPSPHQPDLYREIKGLGRTCVDLLIGGHDALLVPGKTEVEVTAEHGVFNVTRLAFPLSSGEQAFPQAFATDLITLPQGSRLLFCCMARELGNGGSEELRTLFV